METELPAAMASGGQDLQSLLCRILVAMASGRDINILQKNRYTWHKVLRHGKCRIRFSPERTRGAVAWKIFCEIGSVWRHPNGNSNTPILNWNGRERNLNLNWLESDWNGGCRFAVVRKYFCFPPLRRVLFQSLNPTA